MAIGASFTLAEAGFVVGRSSTAINRAIDRGIIRAKLGRRGKARLRTVGPAELRYLAIAAEVEKDLTPAARRRVYEAMRRLPADQDRLKVGALEFGLAEVDRRISARLDRLDRLRTLVDPAGEGGPLLRGTTMSVYVIAALTRGQTVAEVMEDYPGLTAEQVEAAREYEAIHPKAGRPLPTRSFTRMLGDMAESGVWDVENDEEPPTPDMFR